MATLLALLKARHARRREFVEDVADGFSGKPRIDKEKGIVFGVKILGAKSCHGYGYTPECMRAAAGLYEGKAINVDHPQDRAKLGASRSYYDRFGKLHDIEFKEGRDGGLYGNLHYNKKHRVAEQFEYDVEHDPSNLGLSHNASGVASADGEFVESITHVRSVDLVADPATNVSLFEGKGERPMLKLKKGKAKSKQRLMAEFLESVSEHDDLADLLEAAAAAPPEGDAGPQMDTPLAATAKMAAAIFMDESMDTATKRTKIGKLLDLIDDAMPGNAEEDAADGGADDSKETPVKEGKGEKPAAKLGKKPVPAAKPAGGKELAEGQDALLKRLEALETKESVRELCEAAGFTPSKTQLKSLMLLEDEDEVNELIESWAGKGSGEGEPAAKLGPKGAKPKSKPAGGKALLESIDEKDLKGLLV